ncbi:MAG: hypothetical protein AWU55_912 [Halomonadaceae bacterium T82-2]|nr:MAG: hypothetical protein AWU55_912 [Halomonadaceae bacterium T82-2]
MTLFVNGLSHLDASLWSPERGLIGVSWHVDVALHGKLGEDGMLFDFGGVKPWIKTVIDDGPDHTLLVPTAAAGVTVSECREGLMVRTTAPYPMEIRAPRQAYTLLPWARIDRERLATHLSEQLTRHAPPRVDGVEVMLRDEIIDAAGAYTYSHGLKHHDGNCQRIAHGHRSRLHIWCAGRRRPDLEHHWGEYLDDRYLLHAEDCEPDSEAGSTAIRYSARQGHFYLRLPAERCEILPTPTTVEHIARWVAEQTARHHAPGQRVRVQAFEGIDKGALAEAGP